MSEDTTTTEPKEELKLASIKVFLKKRPDGLIIPSNGTVLIDGQSIGGITDLKFAIGGSGVGKLTLELVGAIEFDISELEMNK